MSLLIRAAVALRGRALRSSGGIDAGDRADFYRSIWRAAADELGAELTALEDGFSEIRLGDRRTRMREHLVMLDSPATVSLARSKAFAYRMLAAEGLPVPEFLEFDLTGLKVALGFLTAAGGACVVKPARESAGGDGVTTNIRTRSALVRAAVFGSLYARTLLIERQIPGDVVRLLYLDGVFLDAIRRRPPTVVGDGRSTVRELIDQENERRAAAKGTASNKRITVSPDCRETLRIAGLSLRSVPEPGREVQVKTASNESAESDCESIFGEAGETMIEEGARTAEILGIRLAGLDVITTDPTRGLAETGGKIIDVNASPGLHYHYQTKGLARPVAVPILRTLLETEDSGLLQPKKRIQPEACALPKESRRVSSL